LWRVGNDRLGIAWLDGRNTNAGEHEHAGKGEHAGAMTLRAATFDAQWQRSNETELAAMACDCCQTDAAITAQGPLLVYRGRDAKEIRDIVATRFDGKAWTRAHKVHDDQWTMPGCPVNGPAVTARGNTVVVAWYTEAGGQPLLRLARSNDMGDSFAAPVDVARGADVLGRADVAIDGDQVWVAWLREDAQGQSLQLARYDASLSKQLQMFDVAKLQGRGRATGVPKLAVRSDGVYLAWTDVIDGGPQLRGARITR
jgi:hypothetical protein